MKKLNLILFISLLLGSACSNNSTNSKNNKLIIGKWKSANDSKWSLEFNENYYLDIYSGESSDSLSYNLSSMPICNDNYITNDQEEENLVFINAINLTDMDTLCFEILTLTDSILSIRETSRGYISIYNKQYDYPR